MVGFRRYDFVKEVCHWRVGLEVSNDTHYSQFTLCFLFVVWNLILSCSSSHACYLPSFPSVKVMEAYPSRIGEPNKPFLL